MATRAKSPSSITPPKNLGPEDSKWDKVRQRSKWEHIELYRSISETLFALPGYFKSDLSIAAVLATDLHTFNTALGATIENQIVEALNELRDTWDPQNKYRLYRFVRQAQRFPDVILRSSIPGRESEILLGIELKGWYALARENEPSFRYQVTPEVCAPWDLLAVYPWALSEVTSGQPQLFQPFVTSARYAAEYRNWMWQFGMRGRGDKRINLSAVRHFSPTKAELIADRAVSDGGNNFGRIARTRIMDEYMAALEKEKLSGIPVQAWQRFLSLFGDEKAEEMAAGEIAQFLGNVPQQFPGLTENEIEILRAHLLGIANILDSKKIIQS